MELQNIKNSNLLREYQEVSEREIQLMEAAERQIREIIPKANPVYKELRIKAKDFSKNYKFPQIISPIASLIIDIHIWWDNEIYVDFYHYKDTFVKPKNIPRYSVPFARVPFTLLPVSLGLPILDYIIKEYY